MQAMWGIHNDVFGRELIDGGFISIGWDDIPSLNRLGPDRGRLKELLAERYPDATEGAIRNWAGVLFRFAFEMREGDLVVAPHKPDSTLSFGVVAGPYEYHAGTPSHPHRRRMTWLKTGVARTHFSPAALYEIGSALTLFQVSTHDIEFREFVDASPEDEDLFEGDDDSRDQDESVRPDLAARAALTVLQEHGGPVPRSDVMRRVGERLDGQFTDYESASSSDGKPMPRWQRRLAWTSTAMKGAGWIDKTPEGWLITDDGRAALASHPDGQGLTRAASRAYQDDLYSRRPSSRRQHYAEALEAALAQLPMGTWTSYTELALAVGTNAQTVGTFVSQASHPAGHRVIGHDGRPRDGFSWPDTSRTESQRDWLNMEGVRFDSSGRADEAQRVRAGDFRAYLEEHGLITPPSQRAWLVKGSSVDGQDLVPAWLEQGYVSLRASKLRAVEAGIGRDELKAVVDRDYSQSSYAAKATMVEELHAFLTRMQVDDLVATTTRHGRLHLGVVTGEARSSSDPGAHLKRDIEWDPGEGVESVTLPGPLKARLNVQYQVVELSQQYDILAKIRVADVRQEPGSAIVEALSPSLTLPDATAELAASLHVDRPWLQECIDLLRDRPQLIFYGPPGTGKTYLATALAEYLAGDNVRLVQFHPSYSYEDFFEGYRPDAGGGFALKPGPMRKTVDAARENPSTPYFLVIDEINRGNLAKIFGELYFLLEYRDRNVDLLYATDDDVGFALPDNVFIIGTMNTADRSIALVDAAMRRRFAFLPLHPDQPPSRDVLRRWLASRHRGSEVADLMDALNARIDDPDFKIGPSYFMREAVHAEGGLERTWRTAILPLLEEFHYGDGTDVAATYGLTAIRRRLHSDRPTADARTPDAD